MSPDLALVAIAVTSAVDRVDHAVESGEMSPRRVERVAKNTATTDVY